MAASRAVTSGLAEERGPFPLRVFVVVAVAGVRAPGAMMYSISFLLRGVTDFACSGEEKAGGLWLLSLAVGAVQ